jgi:hypothetical protein
MKIPVKSSQRGGFILDRPLRPPTHHLLHQGPALAVGTTYQVGLTPT